MNRTIEANMSQNLTTSLLTTQVDCGPFLNSIAFKILKTIAFSVLLILALVGNSLVIAVIWRNRRLRTTINFFILNMAVSDILVTIGLPQVMQDIFLPRRWFIEGLLGSITCKLVPFILDVSIIVSILTLEIIAVERFFSIVFPMKRHPINKKKKCFIFIALSWFIAALLPSIYFYKFRIIHVDKKAYCISRWESAFDTYEAIQIQYPIFLVCFTMLPFVLLTGLYSAITISLHRQEAELRLASEVVQRRAKKYRRITSVFLVTWLPVNIYAFLFAYVWKSFTSCDYVLHAVQFLSYTYTAINPFVYYIFNENYGKGFQELLRFPTRCRCVKGDTSVVTMETIIAYETGPRTTNTVTMLSMRSLVVEQ